MHGLGNGSPFWQLQTPIIIKAHTCCAESCWQSGWTPLRAALIADDSWWPFVTRWHGFWTNPLPTRYWFIFIFNTNLSSANDAFCLQHDNRACFKKKITNAHFNRKISFPTSLTPQKIFHFISKKLWWPFIVIDTRSPYFHYFCPTFHHKTPWFSLNSSFSSLKNSNDFLVLNTKYTYFSPFPRHTIIHRSSLHVLCIQVPRQTKWGGRRRSIQYNTIGYSFNEKDSVDTAATEIVFFTTRCR